MIGGPPTKLEEARERVFNTWRKLDAVRQNETQLVKFIVEELDGKLEMTAECLTAQFKLASEFREIWPYRVPKIDELAQAWLDGTVKQKVAELNAEFEAATS